MKEGKDSFPIKIPEKKECRQWSVMSIYMEYVYG